MPPELHKQLFFSMLRIRLVEEKIVELYPQQEMRCPIHLSIGQEAIASGVCATLYPTDAVFSNHRAHGHYLAAGGNLKAFLAEMYGKATGCCQGKGGSMHLIDLDAGFMGSAPIVGGTIPVAVGAALGAVMQGLNKVVVVFFGEATTEEGVFHESANFAALKNLPVVFVCENNLYSVYTGMSERQPLGREVYALAKSHNIPSFQGDGNDVAQVHQMTTEAVQRARSGGGPTFLEFKTYRWREHCGPNYDNDLGYRTEAEFQEWKVRCPIQRTQAQLLEQGILTAQDLDEMIGVISSEVEEAVSFAKSSPFPDPQILFQHIYA
ncbi:thiamine pyrophosphate-dependent dehydrogenase E1 component subunit alpha [Microcoleus anatoxicus]|uniref:Thiamine pyrophosphate-dependent dehydrogenase E1 component subunit alpha n=1 Tax=Microcoleus anatoxicus PTRS2 TaxID=2705321 RepID=A0ABU8YNE2_9CYAN